MSPSPASLSRSALLRASSAEPPQQYQQQQERQANNRVAQAVYKSQNQRYRHTSQASTLSYYPPRIHRVSLSLSLSIPLSRSSLPPPLSRHALVSQMCSSVLPLCKHCWHNHCHTHTHTPTRFLCLSAPPARGPPPYGAHQKIAEPEAVADPVSAFSTRSASLFFDARPLHSFSVVPSLNKGAASQASWRALSRVGLLSRAQERMARALLFAWNQTSVSRPVHPRMRNRPRAGDRQSEASKKEIPPGRFRLDPGSPPTRRAGQRAS